MNLGSNKRGDEFTIKANSLIESKFHQNYKLISTKFLEQQCYLLRTPNGSQNERQRITC
jgi:hypothetical protein